MKVNGGIGSLEESSNICIIYKLDNKIDRQQLKIINFSVVDLEFK